MDLLHAYSKHCSSQSVAALGASARSSQRPTPAERAANTARQLRPAEVDALVALYRAAGNLADVGREFGITRQTVSAHLASRGIETIRRMSAEDVATATKLYRDGRSAASIGRHLAFDAQTVLNGLRQAGVQIRRRPGFSSRPSPGPNGAGA